MTDLNSGLHPTPPAQPCTCDHTGICAACVLAELERDPFVESTSRALRLLNRPQPNLTVVEGGGR